MANDKPERDEERREETRDGPIGGRTEASQVMPEESVLTTGAAATGGTGTAPLGVGGQRHEDGSSRDSEKLEAER